MELFKNITSLIEVLIWPGLILAIILIFRNDLKGLISQIKQAKLPGGIELEMEVKKDQIIEETKNELSKIQNLAIADPEKEEMLRQLVTEKLNEIARVETAIKVDPAPVQLPETSIRDKTMLAFATGESLIENMKYALYYAPVNRNDNYPFKYVGLYADKTVQAVGELKKIASCDLINDDLVGTNGFNVDLLTNDEKQRIIEVIQNTSYYDIRQGHKFYLVDNFYSTYYYKSSAYGIMSKKYFWLDTIPGFRIGMSGSQLASLLNDKYWQ